MSLEPPGYDFSKIVLSLSFMLDVPKSFLSTGDSLIIGVILFLLNDRASISRGITTNMGDGSWCRKNPITLHNTSLFASWLPNMQTTLFTDGSEKASITTFM